MAAHADFAYFLLLDYFILSLRLHVPQSSCSTAMVAILATVSHSPKCSTSSYGVTSLWSLTVGSYITYFLGITPELCYTIDKVFRKVVHQKKVLPTNGLASMSVLIALALLSGIKMDAQCALDYVKSHPVLSEGQTVCMTRANVAYVTLTSCRYYTANQLGALSL